MANPYDIPRSSGNTFLIFSAIAVGSSTGPGVVKLAPTVDAVTGIASMSGGLNNSVLEITPNSAQTGFDVLCKARNTAGVYSFDCAVTSNGDAEHEACTSYFTFQVVLFGADAVHDVIIREYRVDQVVSETLSLSPVCPIHDYRVQGALRTMDDNAYPSDLTLWVQTIDDVDYPRLTGVAERPGIYVASLDVTTYDDNAASGGSGSNFSGGTNMAVPVIVCIYEHPYQVGQLVVRIPKRPKEEHDLIRVIRVNDTDKALYPGIRARFAQSGADWTLTVADEYTTENYLMVLSGGTWTLYGRVYTTGETAPDYTAIATADQVPGCATPPSSGWSNGVVIEGDSIGSIYSADKTVNYGFFDWKGVDAGGHVIAQQKTYWIRQFDGWSRPAEWQHNEGYIYKWDETSGGYGIFTKTGTLVLAAGALFLSEITAICVPYAPPVCEKYNTSAGDIAVRDIMANVETSLGMKIACNMSCPVTPGSLGIKFGDKVGGIWPFYPAHRKWVPYNGTSGDVIQTGGVTVESESGTRVFRDYDFIREVGASIKERIENTIDDLQDTKKGIGITLSGDLIFGKRIDDIPQWFGIFGIPSIEGVYSKSRNYHSYYKDRLIGVPDTTPIVDETITISSSTPVADESERIQSALFCTACAPDAETNKEHQAWSIAVVDIGGGWNADYTTVTTITHDPAESGDGTTTTTTDDSYSGTLRRVMPIPSKTLGAIESNEDDYESRNYTLEIKTFKTYSISGTNYIQTFYRCTESIVFSLNGEDATVTHVFGEVSLSGYSSTSDIFDSTGCPLESLFPVITTTTTYTGTKSAMSSKYDELRAVSIGRAMPSLPDSSTPSANVHRSCQTSRDANETVTYNNYTWSAAE